MCWVQWKPIFIDLCASLFWSEAYFFLQIYFWTKIWMRTEAGQQRIRKWLSIYPWTFHEILAMLVRTYTYHNLSHTKFTHYLSRNHYRRAVVRRCNGNFILLLACYTFNQSQYCEAVKLPTFAVKILQERKPEGRKILLLWTEYR